MTPEIMDFVQTIAAGITILGSLIGVIPQPQSEMDTLGFYLLVGFIVFCVALLSGLYLR
mgnify:CR=1 FL=1